MIAVVPDRTSVPLRFQRYHRNLLQRCTALDNTVPPYDVNHSCCTCANCGMGARNSLCNNVEHQPSTKDNYRGGALILETSGEAPSRGSSFPLHQMAALVALTLLLPAAFVCFQWNILQTSLLGFKMYPMQAMRPSPMQQRSDTTFWPPSRVYAVQHPCFNSCSNVGNCMSDLGVCQCPGGARCRPTMKVTQQPYLTCWRGLAYCTPTWDCGWSAY